MVVPACCISWIAVSDSLYFLVIFPVKNEEIRICWSGRENVTKDNESRESVIHVSINFDCHVLLEDEQPIRAGRNVPS